MEQNSDNATIAQRTPDGRIKWVDIIKGICILFVMLSHSYPPEAYTRFYTPFFLTMFFFAAGMTYKHKDRKIFMKSKAIRLLLPLFGFGLLRIAYYVLAGHDDPLLLLAGLFLQISVHHDELWFLACMFSTYVIFYRLYTAAKKLSEKNYRKILLGASLVLNVLGFADILFLRWKFPWELELACVMIFYMAIGYAFGQNRERIEAVNRIVMPIALVLFLGSVIFIKNDIQIHGEVFDNPIVFMAESLLVILPFTALAKWLEKRKIAVILTYLGRNTLYYFAMSGIVRVIYNYFRPCEVYTNRYVESVICMLLMSVLLVIPITLLHKAERTVSEWLLRNK